MLYAASEKQSPPQSGSVAPHGEAVGRNASRAEGAHLIMASPRGVRARCAKAPAKLSRTRTKVFAIVGKNRDRGGVAPCAAETLSAKPTDEGMYLIFWET